MNTLLALWVNLLVAQSSTLNTAPIQQDHAAKPVAGSSVLFTGFEVQKNSATDFIIQRFLELEQVVKNYDAKKLEEKRVVDQQIRRVVSQVLDVEHLGKRALVSQWEKISALPNGTQKLNDYLSLFRQSVEENYLEKARTYVSGKYQIPLLSESKEGEFIIVRGKIRRQDADLLLEFKVRQNEQGFRVIDVKLDETSLESTYRSSFNRVFRNKKTEEGYAELMRVMKIRLDELKSGEATRL